MNVFQAETKDISRPAILEEKEETAEQQDPTELLEILEKIAQSIEQSLQRMLGKGKFTEAFLQAVDQKSRDYPFLDSLGTNIKAGKGYKIDGSVDDLSDVVFGISDVLDQSVSFLSTPKNREKLKEAMRMGLGPVKMIYEDQIQEYNLDTALFEYLG